MKQILIIIVFGLLFTNFAFCNDTLTMVYRTTAKEPYIKKQPSNQGIWESVYKEAAKKIGLKLEVQRYPKKRAYKMLAEGDVDFYPAASFKKSREKIGYFINSQLKRDGFAVIYRDDLEINNIKDIKGYELLNNLGSTYTFYNRAGIDIKNNTMRQIPELDIQRAVKILQNKMGDIYAYSNIGVKKIFKDHKVDKVKLLEIKNKQKTEHLIFSKKSKYYKEKKNPNYNPDQKLSIKNLPYILDENCIASKFSQALNTMKQNGEIQRILNGYQ